ncbi:hypothetical protein WMY93_007704 [Mugilogobius chulae]|uniref:Myb/SANT-like DNA-binding domain-containing protein n=1 Tax=Mugilogobius chulae TaxID=88201 RepID=A0AAW0PSC8_9GOBI
MNRGQTWAKEEVECLIEIWADEHICAQLSSTHKNAEIYSIFSKQMRERGYLRQILGTKPDVEPVDIVESFEDTETVEPSQSQDTDYQEGEDTEDDANISGTAVSVSEEADASLEDSDVSSVQSEPSGVGGKLEIPGAKSRKRKNKATGRNDDFSQYVAESKRLLEEMREAEARQLEQEQAVQEKILKAQEEANERSYSRMLCNMGLPISSYLLEHCNITIVLQNTTTFK